MAALKKINQAVEQKRGRALVLLPILIEQGEGGGDKLSIGMLFGRCFESLHTRRGGSENTHEF